MFRGINFFSSNSSAGGIQTFKRTFTIAEWKTLFSIPITLISGQGASKIISIVAHTVTLQYHGGTTNYNFGGGDFELIIGGAATVARTSDVADYATGAIFDSFGNTGIGAANAAISLLNTNADSVVGDKIPVLSFKYYIIDLAQ